MKLCILLSDIPFSRDAALALCARLGVEGYACAADEADGAFDPTRFCGIPDFLQRRTAMLDALAKEDCVRTAYFCDADSSGHPVPLGEGLNDLDAYIRALFAMGFDGRAVIRDVHGTDALERSVAYLKQKLSAYADAAK